MSAHAIASQKARRKPRGFLLLPFLVFAGLMAATAGFICYVLWPRWPSIPPALDAPAIPVTVGGVLFEVPPASIRVALQRNPGPHERLDLAFLWPSLEPPPADSSGDGKPPAAGGPAIVQNETAADRLFVTIAPTGSELPPNERLRSIYPRYVEAQASAGEDGLAILPFRAGTPYEGEDLLYVAAAPDRFFALCTRKAGPLPGTCMRSLRLDGADITLRFPRQWFGDWSKVAAGFDRLMTKLHPQSAGGTGDPRQQVK